METLTFVSGAFVHDGSVQNPGPGQLPAIEILNIDTYTSGVRAVFISYFVQGHGTLAHEYNKRVGNIRFTFTTSGSITNEVVFDETSTLDIGNTSGFTFTASHNGFNAILLANNTNGMDMFLNYEAKAFSII